MEEFVKCEFFVDGMHCAACELLIEKKLSKHKGVKKVDAQLANEKVYLEINRELNQDELREELSELITKDGYKLLSNKKNNHKINYKELTTALVIAGVFIG